MITELSVKANGLRLIAHRWDVRSPFYISAFTRDGVATCIGGDGLSQALHSLQSLQNVRNLSDAETHELQNGIYQVMRIRFVVASDIDVGEWTFYIPSQTTARITVQSEQMKRAAELQITRQTFLSLQQGCRTLGRPLRR